MGWSEGMGNPKLESEDTSKFFFGSPPEFSGILEAMPVPAMLRGTQGLRQLGLTLPLLQSAWEPGVDPNWGPHFSPSGTLYPLSQAWLAP